MVRTQTPARERILGAAFTLFGRYGFKRTSMEDIAAEAGLSRTALYLQFGSKEDIFRELAARLHEEALSQAEAALDDDQPIVERLRAAVEAKTLPMIQTVNESPHGSELIDEKNRLCGDLALASERRFQQMLARTFIHADEKGDLYLARSGLRAEEAAELFAQAINGLKGPGVTVARYRKAVASLVRVFVRGLRG